MALGKHKIEYEVIEGWEQMPEGWSFIEVAGVACDSGQGLQDKGALLSAQIADIHLLVEPAGIRRSGARVQVAFQQQQFLPVWRKQQQTKGRSISRVASHPVIHPQGHLHHGGGARDGAAAVRRDGAHRLFSVRPALGGRAVS